MSHSRSTNTSGLVQRQPKNMKFVNKIEDTIQYLSNTCLYDLCFVNTHLTAHESHVMVWLRNVTKYHLQTFLWIVLLFLLLFLIRGGGVLMTFHNENYSIPLSCHIHAQQTQVALYYNVLGEWRWKEKERGKHMKVVVTTCHPPAGHRESHMCGTNTL
jgi:hypothetical protein